MNFHSIKVSQLCKTYGTDERAGLVDYRCDILRQKFGRNEIIEPSKTPFSRFVAQELRSALNVNALCVFLFSLIQYCMGAAHWLWVVVLGAWVVANLLIGAFLNYDAQQPLRQYSGLAAPSAKAVRAGQVCQLPAGELVPGDIILLEEGDRIPADARLMSCETLTCDEAALTGQDAPVLKRAEKSLPENTPLADRVNMIHMGCYVVTGAACAVVVATGMQSEIGHILASQKRDPARMLPVSKALSRLGLLSTVFTALAIIATGVYSSYNGISSAEFWAWGLIMAVGALPAGLSLTSAAILRFGARRLAAKASVIKKTGSLETLGHVTLLCTEKNGVLTQNRTEVHTLWAGGRMTPLNAMLGGNILALIKLAALCNDASIVYENGEERHVGSPSETAILEAAMRNGMRKDKLSEGFPRIGVIPNSPNRMRLTTIHMIGGAPVAVVKGGYDVLSHMCTKGPLDKAERAHEMMSGKGLRVIAVAFKPLAFLPNRLVEAELENELTLAGLIGLDDPLREDAADLVKACAAANVSPVMLTGDHVQTACALARQLGILEDEKQAITGAELALFTDEELYAVVETLRVYARVGPQDKARVIRALQHRHHTVMAFGGGMSDVPAVEAADIGVCMEDCTSEALKNSADLLVTDGGLLTALTAVREGRASAENLTKSAGYLITCCLALLFSAAGALVMRQTGLLQMPQVLLINFLIAPLFALALGSEPPERRTTRPLEGNPLFLLQPVELSRAVMRGLLTAALTMAAYEVGSHLFITDLMDPSVEAGVAMSFAALTFGQLALASASRSLRKPSLSLGLFNNASFNLCALFTSIVAIAAGFYPWTSRLLNIPPVSVVHWAFSAAIALVLGLMLDLFKLPTHLGDLIARRGEM